MEEVETIKAEREVIEQQLKGPVADISKSPIYYKTISIICDSLLVPRVISKAL